MFNYDRMNALARSKGIKKAHICRELGKNLYYLRDSEKNKADISGITLLRIADILGTTPEYLTGETDSGETVGLLQSLRDEDRALLEVARGMTPEQVALMTEFARKMKGTE